MIERVGGRHARDDRHPRDTDNGAREIDRMEITVRNTPGKYQNQQRTIERAQPDRNIRERAMVDAAFGVILRQDRVRQCEQEQSG